MRQADKSFNHLGHEGSRRKTFSVERPSWYFMSFVVPRV